MIAIGAVPAAMIGVAIGAAFLAIAGTVLSSVIRLAGVATRALERALRAVTELG